MPHRRSQVPEKISGSLPPTKKSREAKAFYAIKKSRGAVSLLRDIERTYHPELIRSRHHMRINLRRRDILVAQ